MIDETDENEEIDEITGYLPFEAAHTSLGKSEQSLRFDSVNRYREDRG